MRGDSVSRVITLSADGVVRSLAGVITATLLAKAPDGTTRTATLTIDSVANTLTLTLSAAASAGCPAGLHGCQIQLVDGAGQVRTWPQDPHVAQVASLHVAERI